MTRYVQHKSGIGEKWEVRNECAITWDCTGADTYALYLPKSEYVEVPAPPTVPAPDLWVDITAACGEIMDGPNRTTILYEQTETMGKYDVATIRDGYRLRKVRALIEGGQVGSAEYHWAFIVERREP